MTHEKFQAASFLFGLLVGVCGAFFIGLILTYFVEPDDLDSDEDE